MANELKHKSVGTSMTQEEFEATDSHVLNSQATGDLIYASSASQLSRLGITNDRILISSGGVPTWSVTLPAATLGGTLDANGQILTNTFELYRAFLREFTPVKMDYWGSATQVVSGTGSTNVTIDPRLRLQTGTTAASTAGRYAYMFGLPITAQATNNINWNKKFYMAFTCYWYGTDLTHSTIRVLFTQSSAIESLAAHGLGMETNGANINLATYGTGASATLVSATTNFVSLKRVRILIEHDPAVADRLYINGVLKATQSTAANIPSTDVNASYNIYGSIARSGTETSDELFQIESMEYGAEI